MQLIFRRSLYAGAMHRSGGTLSKLLRVMRITSVILIVCCAHVSAKSVSQTITCTGKDISLKKIFSVVKEQTGYVFIYNPDLVDNAKPVTVNARQMPLEDFLRKILENQSLGFLFKDKTIVITVKETAPPTPLIESGVPNPPTPITGRVVDENNEPVVGASVQIKGTKQGTSTDANGNFIINAESNATLIISYIGFETVEIKPGSTSNISVRMQLSVSSDKQVVVVGYGTQKKATLSGAVSSIKGSDILTTRAPSLAVAMAGKVPGLQIRQQTGMPGDFNTMINIRGFGTPLFVIDGVVRDGDKEFQRLNPEDIESISVLKDASAAIFGINSSNGVILVKTKNGSKGPMRVSYNGLTGVSFPTTHTQMLNVRQFEEIRNEAEINAGRAPLYATREELEAKSNMPNVNWYDEVFKKQAFQQTHTLTFQGGNENLTTFNSIGYMTDNGLLKSGDIGYHKYSFRSNTKAKIASNLTADINISGWADKRYQPGTWDDAFFYLSKATHGMIPSETVYANNNPLYFNRPSGISDNPVAFSNKDYFGYREWRNKLFQSTLSLTYKVPSVQGLQLKLLGAYDSKSFIGTRVQKSVKTYQYSPGNGGTYLPTTNYEPSIREEVNTMNRVDIQAQALYDKKIAGDHNISVALIAESREENERFVFAQRRYSFFTIDNIDRASETGQTNGGWTAKRTYLSYIGRINYNFREKYLLEVASRYDGSYRYAPNKRWGLFTVVSAGWRMSEENFIRDNFSFITNLKLRGSYGNTGQDAGNAFQYIQGYLNAGGYVFNNNIYTNGYSLAPLVNKNLTWVEATTVNVGLDATLWNGLLDFTFDIYRRDRTGLLSRRVQSLPNTFGASLPEENLNSDRTVGLDFLIGHRNRIGSVEYGGSVNLNIGRTKMIYQERAPFRSSMDRYKNGQADRWQDIGWGYEVIGQFRNYDDIRNAPMETSDRANANTLPGDYIHKDVNRDGVIDGKDQVPLFWKGQPKMHFGFTGFINWREFSLSFLLQGSALNSARYGEVLGSVLAFGANSPAFYYDRWRLSDPYNPKSDWIPGYWPASRKNDYDAGSTRIESDANRFSAFYLRLKNVELGYAMPPGYVKPLGVQNIRLFLNGFNLLVFSNKYLKNFDPEINDGNGFSYPLSVGYNFGVNITF